MQVLLKDSPRRDILILSTYQQSYTLFTCDAALFTCDAVLQDISSST